METFKKCKVESCINNAHYKNHGKRGYCGKHYWQFYTYGKIMDEQWNKEKEDRLNKKCKINNCKNSAFYKNGGEKGYCSKHYMQFHIYGKILERTKNNPNEIIDCSDYYEVILYGFVKKGEEPKEIARTKIDKENLKKVKSYKWYFSHGYATNKTKNKVLFLHQLILGKKNGFEIDHINHDTLDNRKQNLRFATRSQNMMNNKSKGYYWDKKSKKWCGRIMKNYKTINLGYFIDEQIAQRVVQEARQKFFGEFAYKNN